MRLILLFFMTFFLSCNKNVNNNINSTIDINDNLSFDQFKELIEKNSKVKDYPDINKWKKL